MPNREETIRDHQERLNRVMLHIQEHLDEPLSLETLAGVACFSPFHFHRLFAAYTGETLNGFIRRLRLEWAAHRLSHTGARVTDIALDAGYETPAAFTRAFAQHFRESPLSFRKKKQAWVLQSPRLVIENKHKETIMKPEMRTRPEKTVIYVRRTGPYGNAARQAWEAVCGWAGPRRLIGRNSEFVGISYDDPEITAPDKLRYDACIAVDRPVAPEGEIGVQTLAGGKYVMFLHKGPYEKLGPVYRQIYAQWLPASGERLRDVPCFEVYLNDPGRTKPENLLTEIHIPVE